MLIHDFRVTLRQLDRLSSIEDVAALNFIWMNGNLVISFNSLLRHQYWQLTTLSIWISSNTERSAFLSVTLNDICDSDFALLFYFIFFVYWFSYRKMKNQIRLRPIKYLLALRVPHPYLKKNPPIERVAWYNWHTWRYWFNWSVCVRTPRIKHIIPCCVYGLNELFQGLAMTKIHTDTEREKKNTFNQGNNKNSLTTRVSEICFIASFMHWIGHRVFISLPMYCIGIN